MTRRALITGVRGQDGAYLSRLLLDRGYVVHGLGRTDESSWRLAALGAADRVSVLSGDVRDPDALDAALAASQADEVYNLAAQSSVRESFERPVESLAVGALGAVQVLEAIRRTGRPIRVYQASSSEMFGQRAPAPQDIDTPFFPSSPYAVAKHCAHQMTRAYREAYGLFAVSGILFNHESPLRDPGFVTRKITMAVAAIAAGRQDRIRLGNLEARRDFGYAPEYVEAMWLMLQQDEPRDYVIATGVAHSIREFAERAFRTAGLRLDDHLEIDPGLLRPADQNFVVGDPTRAREHLGWSATTTFDELVELMVVADRERLAREGGDA